MIVWLIKTNIDRQSIRFNEKIVKKTNQLKYENVLVQKVELVEPIDDISYYKIITTISHNKNI